MYEHLSIISLREPARWDAAVQPDAGRAGDQAKALSFTAHCYAWWWVATVLPKVWTIWRLTCLPTCPVDLFDKLGLNLFLEDLLFAESPKLVYQLLLGIGSIYAKWAPPADSGFDGVWAATVSAAEPVVAAFQPAASFLR
jgi:hypothetical protein